jgi:hypothetical protein
MASPPQILSPPLYTYYRIAYANTMILGRERGGVVSGGAREGGGRDVGGGVAKVGEGEGRDDLNNIVH